MKQQRGLRAVGRTAAGVLERLVVGLDELGAHRRIDSARGTFMAIVVERVNETPHGPIFSVAHYFEQDGDLVPDPDVTFLRAEDGEFYPLTYQDARVFRCAVDLEAGDSVCVDARKQTDLAAFVTMWMQNVRVQQSL